MEHLGSMPGSKGLSMDCDFMQQASQRRRPPLAAGERRCCLCCIWRMVEETAYVLMFGVLGGPLVLFPGVLSYGRVSLQR